MNEDYLWDQSGVADPIVAQVERLVAPFGHGRSPRRAPPRPTPRRPRMRGVVSGFVFGAAAALLAGWWALAGASSTTTPPSPRPSPDATMPSPVSHAPVTHHVRVPIRRPRVHHQPEAEPEDDPPVEVADRPPHRRPVRRRAPQAPESASENPPEPVKAPSNRPSDNLVASRVAAYARQITRCFARDPSATAGAMVIMSFDVERDGAAVRPQLVGHSLADDASANRVSACLSTMLQQWRFAPSRERRRLRAPFIHAGSEERP